MNFQIHFDVPPLEFAILAAIAAGLSYLMYRKLEGVSGGRQLSLGALRAVSLFLLLLAVVNVATNILRFTYTKHRVFVLLDDSKSMSLTDGTANRPQEVRRVLGSAAFQEISKRFSIKPEAFGRDILKRKNIDSLRFDQPSTNIEAALSAVARVGEEGRTAFAILISDGEYNTGGNPIGIARNLRFPVFTVGIGDSTQPRDVVVRQVIPAPSLYAGKASVVKALIGSNGFGGARVTARLYEDGREVDSKELTLPQFGNTEVSFNYIPGTAGSHMLRVYVPPLQGEFSTANNSVSTPVDVRKGKYSILFVAGEPSADAAFLRRNIESDGNFDLKALIEKNGDSFYEKNTAQVLSGQFDAVVLCDFPTARSAATLTEVVSLLTAKPLPYIYLAGPGFSQPKFERLPRRPFSANGFESGEISAGVSPVSPANVPIALQQVFSLIQSSSSLFPPLYYQHIQCAPSIGGAVLADPVVNGTKLNSPLFIVNESDRSAAFLAYGLWRLQLMSSLSGLRPDFLHDFITGLLQTLINSGNQRLLTVRTGRRVYDPSEPIDFNAVLVNSAGAPVDEATVDLTVKNSRGMNVGDVNLPANGGGGYSGSLSGLAEGRYTFEARAKSGTVSLGVDSGSVVVAQLNTEFIRTEMNASLLRQIAAVSGGRFMTPAEFVADGIPPKPDWLKPVKLANSTEFELLSSLPILALVALLLAVEWTMRKIWGLP